MFHKSKFTLPALISLSLGGYPLVASLTSILGVDNRPVSIAFRAVVVALSAFLIFELLAGRIRRRRNIIGLFIGVFWLLYLIRLSLDTVILGVPLSQPAGDYWLWVIGGSFLPMLALTATTDRATYERMLVASLYVLTIAVVLVLSATHLSVIAGTSRVLQIGRIELAALNPISAGHLGGSVVIIATFVILSVKDTRRLVYSKVFLIAAIVCGLVLAVLSGSRGAFLGTAVPIIMYGVARWSRKSTMLTMVFSILLVVGSYIVATYAENAIGLSPIARVQSALRPESDLAVSIRFELLQSAWLSFTESPLFGSGLEGNFSGVYPHNVIVESFMSTGVVGGMAFTIIVVLAGWRSWKLLRIGSEQGWLGMLCIQYLVAAQFSGALWGNTLMWTVVGAISAVGLSRKLGHTGHQGWRRPSVE